MRRVVIAALAAVTMMAGVVAPMAGPSVVLAAQPAAVPKVVVIVGPSGAATNRYRAEARAAADLARTFTPDVTELYSPNATWPAARQALQGASLVIYMGHGNGWPSKYRDELFGGTQNGFGLNPSAGGNDDTHQYFGESSIADEIRLAPDAVVLLNHLCYASGSSEPGLPEGTLKEARQRVDNYAAGFIRAGASAVVAEAYASPDHLVRSILGSRRSIETSWRRAPSANSNVQAFESSRSPGYVAMMDTTGGTSGFERSIVLRSGLASADVLRGARGSATGAPLQAAPADPSLLETGLTVGAPTLRGTTVAGEPTRVRLGYDIDAQASLPRGMRASVRWDALDPVAPVVPVDGDVMPDFGIIVPERPGDVVEPVDVGVAATGIGFDVVAPASPGRYRLSVTLHDPRGVAYDAATQALVPALLVRITGELDAGILVAGSTEVTAGTATDLPLWVANLGRDPWGAASGDRRRQLDGGEPASAARVFGQWLAVADDPDQRAAASVATASGLLPAGHEPGTSERIELALTVPTVPGEYLLVLDIVTPDGGSLIAAGREPTLVRFVVSAPEPPAPRQ